MPTLNAPEGPRLLTLGHGTASEEELAGLIRGAGIEHLVDVRTVPKSRRHPHFWREEMACWVPELSGSGYGWQPALGGFRKPRADSANVGLRNSAFRGYADYMETGEFRAALEALVARAAGARVAVMCSETVWWRCHRRLIADAVTLLYDGHVQHLMHDGRLQPHLVTPGACVTATGAVRYVPTSPSQQLDMLDEAGIRGGVDQA